MDSKQWIGFKIFRKMKKRMAKCYVKKTVEETSTIDDINVVESLEYDFISIQIATNNFSEAYKIGHGSFGPVYKAKFQNGQEVAVKRLSKYSRQGSEEFKNEVALLAKLQHKNLVRLLGFCLEGKEMLLVYEFVHNGGLDGFLFDPIKCGYLDWGRRYNIIERIGRGLVYLHEDSRLRIVHRCLNASDILLDADLNPKIADFGMAWLFAFDETHSSADRVVGTYGYLAPEYAMHGEISVKVDVFNFGLLVLEIISGQKISSRIEDSMEDLLSCAWIHWKGGCALNVIDPMLRGLSSPVDDIAKCIHVALLCAQEKAADRPTMSEVLQMLSNLSMSLPVPSAPAYFYDRSVNSEDSEASIN